MKMLTAIALGVLGLSGCAGFGPSTPIAVTELKPTQGNNVHGTVSFIQKNDQVLVDARIKGLKPGLHGFHIHEKGDCSAPDASSAGGHFNPTGEAHGAPGTSQRHGGDLGNLEADANGNATLTAALPRHGISMAKGGPDSIVGRALIVHADPDDYVTQPTGNSGKRVACGVIDRQ